MAIMIKAQLYCGQCAKVIHSADVWIEPGICPSCKMYFFNAIKRICNYEVDSKWSTPLMSGLSQARGVCSVSVGHNGLLGSISLSTSGFLITGFYPDHFSSSARPALLSASLCNRVNNWQRHLLDWRVWSLHFSRFASWMSPYFQDKTDNIGTSCMLLHLHIKYHFGSLV